jgi:hypothetical protein
LRREKRVTIGAAVVDGSGGRKEKDYTKEKP